MFGLQSARTTECGSCMGGGKLNKRRKPLSFEEEVRKQIKDWRRRQAFIKEFLEEPERQATEDPALGIAVVCC